MCSYDLIAMVIGLLMANSAIVSASKKDIMQGIAYGFHKYAGPKPPKFQTHRYRFLIYSLDTMLNISPNIMKKKLIKAMNGHILQAGMTVGSFKR